MHRPLRHRAGVVGPPRFWRRRRRRACRRCARQPRSPPSQTRRTTGALARAWRPKTARSGTSFRRLRSSRACAPRSSSYGAGPWRKSAKASAPPSPASRVGSACPRRRQAARCQKAKRPTASARQQGTPGTPKASNPSCSRRGRRVPWSVLAGAAQRCPPPARPPPLRRAALVLHLLWVPWARWGCGIILACRASSRR